jgi:hypothetical protein
MIAKSKCLFVLHEGIGSTIFNSQVLEHSIGMKNYEFDIDILSYNTFSKSWNLSKANHSYINQTLPNIKLFLFKALNIYNPFSYLYNSILLIIFFLKNKNVYKLIHARADYTAFLCILTKPFHKLPVIWDCRGDSISELQDSLSRKNIVVNFFGNFIFVNINKIICRFNSKYCDGAVFVSDALFQMYRQVLYTKYIEIIPCPVPEEKFYYSLTLRNEMRKLHSIPKETKVCLYSGSMIAYQSIGEQIELYRNLLLFPDVLIIIATSEPDLAKLHFSDFLSNRFKILSVKYEEMNSFYNMADFSFLIRDNKILNNVASPTKFGEYCLTGLPVIMNDTVYQSLQISKLLGNYISHFDSSLNVLSNSRRQEIADASINIFSRKFLNQKYMKLYKSVL